LAFLEHNKTGADGNIFYGKGFRLKKIQKITLNNCYLKNIKNGYVKNVYGKNVLGQKTFLSAIPQWPT